MIARIRYPAWAVGIVLGLLGIVLRLGSPVLAEHVQAGQTRAGSNSDMGANSHWAWSTNAGWINLSPTHGGVAVYADHLEGTVWAENIGWIRLGSYAGGGAHTYGNTSGTDYGVNRDPSGNLSGFAWSTNVGWIKFDPAHGGVTIDPNSGDLGGYAWSENVGWIRFIEIHHICLPLVLRN
jgi:hypothetical protein